MLSDYSLMWSSSERLIPEKVSITFNSMYLVFMALLECIICFADFIISIGNSSVKTEIRKNKNTRKPSEIEASEHSYVRYRTGDEGIEPPPKVLETPIIPLDQSPMCLNRTRYLYHIMSIFVKCQIALFIWHLIFFEIYGLFCRLSYTYHSDV